MRTMTEAAEPEPTVTIELPRSVVVVLHELFGKALYRADVAKRSAPESRTQVAPVEPQTRPKSGPSSAENPPTSRPTKPPVSTDAAGIAAYPIRVWARQYGHNVPERGRLSRDVILAWREAFPNEPVQDCERAVGGWGNKGPGAGGDGKKRCRECHDVLSSPDSIKAGLCLTCKLSAEDIAAGDDYADEPPSRESGVKAPRVPGEVVLSGGVISRFDSR